MKIDFNLTLENEKVLLRPLIQNDYKPFSELVIDPSMWIYFTSDLSLASELKDWIAQALHEMENKNRLAFTVIDKSKNKMIGSTSFGNISYHDKRIEIGWTWLVQSHQGKGFNQEMKLLMLKYCFEKIDFERVEFKTDVLNMPARKALLKMGAKEEGVLRSHTLMTHGRRRDTVYYSVLKDEWPQIKIQFYPDTK